MAIDPSLLRSLERLSDLYSALHNGNIDFLKQDDRPEHLNLLLDLRELSYEEIKGLLSEMVEALQDNIAAKIPELQTSGSGSVRDLIVLLSEVFPEDSSRWREKLRQALEQLVQSDQRVYETIEKRKAGISNQLKTVRRGSRLMRGYRQADPMGSCFIDKIK